MLYNGYIEAIVSRGTIWGRWFLPGVLDIALHVNGAHNERVGATSRRSPRIFPEDPGEVRERMLEGSAAPGITGIEADINLRDAFVT